MERKASIMKIRTRIGLTGAATALAMAGAAAPAMAGGPSGSGNVSVNSTVTPALYLTLSGLTPTITLNGQAGTTATAPGAEDFTIVTNDTGFTVTITPSNAGLEDTAGDAIPNNDLGIQETTGVPNAPTVSFDGADVLTLLQQTGLPGPIFSATLNENWSLAIPASAAADTYSEQFTYTAIGS
jgi:hypothetical protein